MSLVSMSTEAQDRELAGRKRSHGDFLNPESCGPTAFRDSDHFQTDHSLSDKENDVQGTPFEGLASPHAKSSSSLSEPASSPLNPRSPSPSPAPANPSTPAQSTSATVKSSAQKATAGEPPKKKRLTTEEKAARDAEKRKRDEEREKKKREKDEAEKLKTQQKAAKAEAEKLKAQQKAEEKAAKAADKAEKEQEKKQRAEEREKKKREKEEEEAKKARSQMRLTSMFNRTAITPKKEAASKSDNGQSTGATAKNEAREASLYDQMFKPFFIKEHVKLARHSLEMDEETREAKTKILDEYLSGKRQHPTTTFEPLEALQIPYKVCRGRVYPSVKKIMSEFESLSTSNPSDQTTESQNAQMRHTLEVLKSVPIKSIKFREDVRPPYIGTISGLPPGVKSLQKLARNPVSKILPLNYDYDSEAEWQEEEGEDVDDLDDDEEDVELDEDMDDFLDDSEDAGPARRVFSGGMEPESYGPCWENRNRSLTEPKLYKYRLEFVLEPLEHHHSIDPFSTSYWESPKPKAGASNEPSAASASTTTPATTASASSSSAQDARTNPMAPPPAPADAFQALNPGAAAAGSKKSQQPLPLDMQQKLKDLVRSMPNLSKVGVIELFAASHAGCSRNQIKTSFDAIFEKSGKVFKVKGE